MMEKTRRMFVEAFVLAAAICAVSGCGRNGAEEAGESAAETEAPAAEEGGAVFADGREACRIMKELAGNGASSDYGSSDIKITGFVRSEALPGEGYSAISAEDSPEPIYAWYEEGAGEICWYAESPEVFLNADSSHMFYNMRSLSDISGLSDVIAGNCADFSYMFGDCRRLSDVSPISGWDTGAAESLEGMFDSCVAFEGAGDVSGWDTGNVSSFALMFSGCTALEDADPLSAWDTSGAASMVRMFAYCTGLKRVDLSGWDVSSVESMGGMFVQCGNLTELDLSGWDVGSLSDSARMFGGCGSLAAIYVDGETGDWASSCASVEGGSYMFPDCPMTGALQAEVPDDAKYGMAMARPFDGTLGYFTLLTERDVPDLG